jgi:hypothetical protein
MHRLITRLLLLVALAGNIGPAAMAAASQAHACCVRKAMASCHRSPLVGSGVSVIQSVGCCNQGCGRAVISLRWTATPAQGRDFFNPEIEARLAPLKLSSERTETVRSAPARAPPAC